MDVLILIGSKSDLSIAKDCQNFLNEFSVSNKLVIASAHRAPEFLELNLKEAKENNVKYIIAMAGMSAHLPGVIASKTLTPVIGVPISNKNLGGLDAMYSIINMPSGYPVATVGIDSGKNAAILACQLLAVNDINLKNKLEAYRNKIKEEIIASNKEL